jgi:hypothetical protein
VIWPAAYSFKSWEVDFGLSPHPGIYIRTPAPREEEGSPCTFRGCKEDRKDALNLQVCSPISREFPPKKAFTGKVIGLMGSYYSILACDFLDSSYFEPPVPNLCSSTIVPVSSI